MQTRFAQGLALDMGPDEALRWAGSQANDKQLAKHASSLAKDEAILARVEEIRAKRAEQEDLLGDDENLWLRAREVLREEMDNPKNPVIRLKAVEIVAKVLGKIRAPVLHVSASSSVDSGSWREEMRVLLQDEVIAQRLRELARSGDPVPAKFRIVESGERVGEGALCST